MRTHVLEQRPAPALGAADYAGEGPPAAAALRQRGPEADGGTRVRRVKRQPTSHERVETVRPSEVSTDADVDADAGAYAGSDAPQPERDSQRRRGQQRRGSR